MGKYDFGERRKTPAGNCSVAFNQDYIIKIEHTRHPWKLRTLDEEIEIIKYLNDKGCVSCPKLADDGTAQSGQRYYIQERIINCRPFNPADMMFSILEQKNFGVCQNDFKKDNFLFDNNSVCYIVDYDQALRDDKIISMGNLEYLEWYNDYFVDRWRKIGDEWKKPNLYFSDFYTFGDLDKQEILSLFRNGSFNLGATTVFKEQITTNTESGFYHKLDTDTLYIDGARDLKPRTAALDTIEFKDGEAVLDVGCNMGLLSHYLHDRGCKVTGVEMDEKMVIGAKMVANILGKNIRFEYKDVDKTKITEKYDTVCLFSVLPHLQNIQAAAENISQICDRIILECRLVEYGSKPIDGKWCGTSKWSFNSQQELIKFCESIFKGFKFLRTHGKVDRDREILTFIKEVA